MSNDTIQNELQQSNGCGLAIAVVIISLLALAFLFVLVDQLRDDFGRDRGNALGIALLAAGVTWLLSMVGRKEIGHSVAWSFMAVAGLFLIFLGWWLHPVTVTEHARKSKSEAYLDYRHSDQSYTKLQSEYDTLPFSRAEWADMRERELRLRSAQYELAQLRYGADPGWLSGVISWWSWVVGVGLLILSIWRFRKRRPPIRHFRKSNGDSKT